MRFIRKVYQFFVDRPLKEGTVLNGRYKLLQVIGAGSYGIVYLCKDMETSEKKAIKQLRPSKRRNKKEVKMFKKEIAILEKLNHKNIPKVFEQLVYNDNLFYVMSFVEGDNLEEEFFLHTHTFNEKESLIIITHLLELVNYLHSKGIYHQDLRIPNMLLKNKKLFLIDFGLSVCTDTTFFDSHTVSFKEDEILEMERQDYFDLGEVLLFLLYTTFEEKSKKALPWMEELNLEKETVHLLKRLLQIEEPYSNTNEISADLQAALFKR